jgi:hypothetical protein
MNNANYRNIKIEIRLHAKKNNKWWKTLQKDSVAEWMLLTTFGCRGIPNRLFQLLAFIITLLVFAGKLHRTSEPV